MTDLLAGVKLFNACYEELLKMNIENRAREYLAKHSEYSEVFGGTFIAVDTLTAMVEFAKQETKEKSDRINKAKEIIKNLLILKNDHYGNTKMEWRVKVTEQAEQFLSEVEK